MRHLDEGTIHAWLDGALSDGESTNVSRHVGECAACAALVAEARGLIAGASRIVTALDVTRGGVIPPVPASPAAPASSRKSGDKSLWRRLQFTPARAAIAATLLVAIGSMLTVQQTSDKSEPRLAAPAAAPKVAAAIDTLSSRRGANVSSPAQPAPRTPATMSSRVSARVSAPNAALDERARQLAAGARDSLAKVTAQQAQNQMAIRDAAAPTREVAAAPPPASSVADSMRRAPTEARVVGGIAAGSRGGGGRAAVVSLNEMVTTTSVGARADTAARKAAADRAGFAVATDFQRAENRSREGVQMVVVCYALTSAVPRWASVVPERFALDPMSVSDTAVGRRVVRRVTAEGKIDGPIAGGWWRRLGTDTVPVVVTWTDANLRAPVTLSLSSDSASRRLTGMLRESSRSESVSVSFAPCSP